ncbi:MAG: hypothetical protein ABI859_08170 [Pseudomonadota bacterium]
MPYEQDIEAIAQAEARDEIQKAMRSALSKGVTVTAGDVVHKGIRRALSDHAAIATVAGMIASGKVTAQQLLAAATRPAVADVVPLRKVTPASQPSRPPPGPAAPGRPLPLAASARAPDHYTVRKIATPTFTKHLPAASLGAQLRAAMRTF